VERRLRSLLVRFLAACVPVAVLVIASGAGNASAAHVPANARAAALASLRHLMIGEQGTNHATGAYPILNGLGPKQVTSGNWSGYADDGGKTYNMVAARWKEPAVTCPPASEQINTMAAFWVGIDGYASGSVEQDGTLAYCFEGSAFYYTWWEMYPKNAIQIVSSAVKPGDEITASVTRKHIQYQLKVSDFTTSGNSFTEYRTCGPRTCTNSSAEWVAEAPTESSGKRYPLADFGTWMVNAASARSGLRSGTISTFPAYEITMKPSTTVLARPGRLNRAGTWFTDTWEASTG
jgi:hypothetical protein